MKNSILILLLALSFASCGRGGTVPADTPTSGVIRIAADENFEPIVAQQIALFENKYPAAGIVPTYTSQTDAIRLLLEDSVRMIVTSKLLTAAQKTALKSRKLFAREIHIATDAIAVIVNKSNPDTLMSVGELRRLMTEGGGKVVFDNQNSGTVQYVLDSICGGRVLSDNSYAQGSSRGVIEYVESDPEAVGIIVVSWINDLSDTTGLSFSDRVSVVALSNSAEATKSNAYKPYQAYIAMGDYPLKRNIYAILSDPRNGLATGFTTFICSEIGQRIMLRSAVVPATQPVRIIQIKEQ